MDSQPAIADGAQVNVPYMIGDCLGQALVYGLLSYAIYRGAKRITQSVKR